MGIKQMKSIRCTAILMLFIAISSYGYDPEISFTPSQVKTSLEILEKMSTKHYAARPLDDQLSQQLFSHYLDTLDPARIYFTSADINGFNRWKDSLDDSLRRGDLTPGFEIFNLYRQRVADRLNRCIELLQQSNSFDFNFPENLSYEDSENLPWIASEEALNELWRKRIKDSYLRLLLAKKPTEEIPELLITRYKNQLARLEQTDAEDVFVLYMNAFTSLYDPHSNYYSPRQLENFNISMSLKLEGIGAVLQMDDEITEVVRIIPGGPADRQGVLAPEDKIIGVGQGNEKIRDVIGWRLDDVVDLIRGPKGTSLRLEINPAKGEGAGQSKIITLIRDEVKLEEQAAKSRVLNIEADQRTYSIGVISLPTFYIDFEAYNRRDPNYKSTTRDVARLLHELQESNVDGVILDLRNNGGGSLQEVTTMTDLFINPGPVVQVRNAHMISRRFRSKSAPLYKGPLLVLINRLSASASEIFAGAIQDYGRGLVVGTQTYGKGTVQAMVPVHEGEIKLTESKFYRVSGDSTQHRGVMPDIELPSIFNLDEIGESSQDHALPWDQIHPIPISKHNDYSSLIPKLKLRHQERIAKDPDYLYLTKELEISEKYRKLTQIPLRLEDRKSQQSAFDRQLFELENERRLAKSMEPLKSIDQWKKNMSTDSETETESSHLVDEDDPLLKEAGMILLDQVLLTNEQPLRVVDGPHS